MNAPWDREIGCTYVLTADDVEDGKNKLGMDVSDIPLNTLLCCFCDTPVDSEGRCFHCRTIHMDAELQFTEVHGDPLLKRDAT